MEERREHNKENIKPIMENEKKSERIPPPDFVLGFRAGSSGKELGGAQSNPKDIFGDDSDEETDHTESVRRFTKKNYGQMMPGRNTFNTPKIGKRKSIEQIRSDYAFEKGPKMPKRQSKQRDDNDWDDETFFETYANTCEKPDVEKVQITTVEPISGPVVNMADLYAKLDSMTKKLENAQKKDELLKQMTQRINEDSERINELTKRLSENVIKF